MIQMIRDVICHICASGLWTDGDIRDCFCYANRKPIKPKDEKMDKTLITARVSMICGFYDVDISLDEAERLGGEAKRIKAEMAKREKIGPGDIFVFCKSIRKAVSIDGDTIMDTNGNPAYNPHCKKLHPTPEVRAWLDKTIGGEG